MGRVLANLIGFLGDFDLAEEAAQEAFAIAAERWPREWASAKPCVLGAGGDSAPPCDRPHPPRAHARRSTPGRWTCRGSLEDDVDETTIPDERLELLFHLLPPGARPGRPGRAHATQRSAVSPRGRSPEPSSYPSRRWQSCLLLVPSVRSGLPGSRFGCRPPTCSLTGWPPCWPSST